MDIMREGITSGREAFVQALRDGLQLAAAQGCRELCWMDANYLDWPLSEAAVLEALTQWAYPHRRLMLLATQYEDLRRRHPRFVQWRQTWDHVLSARQYQSEDLERRGPVGILLAPGLFSLRLLDAEQWRASLSVRAADEIGAREWFDAVWQRSSESFPASTLGL